MVLLELLLYPLLLPPSVELTAEQASQVQLNSDGEVLKASLVDCLLWFVLVAVPAIGAAVGVDGDPRCC